ncbi:hypothetical protein MMC29_004893 [Sticta canariensis]|nr:hypothetical protein [Sticta canariensis]
MLSMMLQTYGRIQMNFIRPFIDISLYLKLILFYNSLNPYSKDPQIVVQKWAQFVFAMSSTRSSSTKPQISRPLTTSIALAECSTADLDPLSHDERMTKGINSVPSVQSPKTLQTVFDYNDSRAKPLDLFDRTFSVGEESDLDEEATESVSDFSDYPAGLAGVKPPEFGCRSGRKQTPLTTETFSAGFGDDGRSRKGSESTDDSFTFSDIYGRRKGSEVSRQGDWNQGPPLEDSPTMGRNFTASMKGLKSPTMDSQGRHFSISTGDEKSPTSPGLPTFQRTSNSPNPTVNSIATTSTSPRAERGRQLPFLPKILKGLGSPAGTELSPKCDEPEAVNKAHTKSAFEDESSDDDDEDIEEGIEIHQARLGVVGRPVLVHHPSSTVVDLKEMLRSGPCSSAIHSSSLGPRSNPEPSTTKVARLLGHEVIIHTDPISSVAQTSLPPSSSNTRGPSTAKVDQILGREVPIRNGVAGSRKNQATVAGSTTAPIAVKEKNNRKSSPTPEREITVAWADEDGLGSWRNPVSNLADGLRLNPVLATAKMRRSATVPSRRKQEGADPQAHATPLASAPSTIPPPPPHSQLNKAVNTDQDHYVQVMEERLYRAIEELVRLRLELSSLKETINGPKNPRRKASQFFNGLFRRK